MHVYNNNMFVLLLLRVFSQRAQITRTILQSTIYTTSPLVVIVICTHTKTTRSKILVWVPYRNNPYRSRTDIESARISKYYLSGGGRNWFPGVSVIYDQFTEEKKKQHNIIHSGLSVKLLLLFNYYSYQYRFVRSSFAI